jgi:hypothetical protein
MTILQRLLKIVVTTNHCSLKLTMILILLPNLPLETIGPLVLLSPHFLQKLHETSWLRRRGL